MRSNNFGGDERTKEQIPYKLRENEIDYEKMKREPSNRREMRESFVDLVLGR